MDPTVTAIMSVCATIWVVVITTAFVVSMAKYLYVALTDTRTKELKRVSTELLDASISLSAIRAWAEEPANTDSMVRQRVMSLFSGKM